MATKIALKKNFSGFVLKSRSDEAPVRRRSLVERTGMKNLMQVNIFISMMVMVYKTFVANASMIMETSAMIQMTMTMMTTKMKPIKMTTWMCNSERPL